jgi:hypothetical protein
VARRALLAVPAAAVAGCIPVGFATVQQARTQMLGLDRNEVRMCAGFPTKTYTEKNLEIWSYEKTAPPAAGLSLPVLPMTLGASMTLNGGGDCRLQLMFQNGKVTRIAYAVANSSVSGQNERCAPLVSECVRYARSRMSSKSPAGRAGPTAATAR